MILNRTSKRQRTPVVNTLMRRKLSNYSLVHLFPTRATIEKKKRVTLTPRLVKRFFY